MPESFFKRFFSFVKSFKIRFVLDDIWNRKKNRNYARMAMLFLYHNRYTYTDKGLTNID